MRYQLDNDRRWRNDKDYLRGSTVFLKIKFWTMFHVLGKNEFPQFIVSKSLSENFIFLPTKFCGIFATFEYGVKMCVKMCLKISL